MAKNKKKKHKKDDASEDILDVAALSIRKFRKVTKEIGRLSTGQKLVGGIALVAAGLAYLASQEEEGASPEQADEAAAPKLHAHRPEADDDTDDYETEGPRGTTNPAKSPKSAPSPARKSSPAGPHA
ncbi:hypothetical protein MUN81_05445 [Hymenobacter sp. 5317J-9]|uniref:hypothetical protein n=1 Tax=Hymenobacter sp. 5317J-9 TaxID=2932250 RepID=UPI001FD64616|nr:hypothetical protein [Hymenobacter sp. 5317J-9]UOQ98935.1 hypothetical protein MUN81_05445 [Hymenobacter sp. 5317J-9]